MIRVEAQDEDGVGLKKPIVRIYKDDKLVCEVHASLQHKQGADGGYCQCVVFDKKEHP